MRNKLNKSPVFLNGSHMTLALEYPGKILSSKVIEVTSFPSPFREVPLLVCDTIRFIYYCWYSTLGSPPIWLDFFHIYTLASMFLCMCIFSITIVLSQKALQYGLPRSCACLFLGLCSDAPLFSTLSPPTPRRSQIYFVSCLPVLHFFCTNEYIRVYVL